MGTNIITPPPAALGLDVAGVAFAAQQVATAHQLSYAGMHGAAAAVLWDLGQWCEAHARGQEATARDKHIQRARVPGTSAPTPVQAYADRNGVPPAPGCEA